MTFALTSCSDSTDGGEDSTTDDVTDYYDDSADDDYSADNDTQANDGENVEENEDSEEDSQPEDTGNGIQTVDPTLADAVIDGAAGVESETIVIEGVEYAMPFDTDEMTANGWDSPYLDSTTLAAGEAAAYDLVLESNGAGKITAMMFQNTSDKECTLRECEVIGLTLNGYGDEYETVCSFVLPGGVTQNATMSDLKNVYGEEDTENYLVEITESSGGDEFAITGRTGYNYDIDVSFNRDGTIRCVNIQCQGWTFS